MKKVAIILFICILFQSEEGWVSNKSEDIFVLANEMIAQGLTIEEWEVVYVEEVSLDTFKHVDKRLRSDFYLKERDHKQVSKLSYTQKNKKTTITTEVQAIVPKGGNDSVQLHVTVKGNKWDDDLSDEFNNLTEQVTSKLQIDFDKIFTCIKANNNGIMNVGFSIEKLMEKWNVLHRKTYHDNVRNSNYGQTIYGYTSLFSNEININNERVNLQITERILNKEKKQIIIGTPIMLNEY